MKISPKKINQAGFSMMELVVVMVIMLIIMGAAFTLMRGTIITANANYEMTSASQGLRNSQEFLTRDILTLGDGIKDLGKIWLPTRFAATYLTVRAAGNIDPTATGYVSMGGVLSDD